MKECDVTIFKLSKDLKNYFVSKGKIVQNLNEDNLCRTQIKVKSDDNLEAFMSDPISNHLIVFYGNHKNEVKNKLG